jgi:hypothetical protein
VIGGDRAGLPVQQDPNCRDLDTRSIYIGRPRLLRVCLQKAEPKKRIQSKAKARTIKDFFLFGGIEVLLNPLFGTRKMKWSVAQGGVPGRASSSLRRLALIPISSRGTGQPTASYLGWGNIASACLRGNKVFTSSSS